MASFSAILSDPQVRGIVQEGLLERAFHDALFPLLMYRGEAIDKVWPGNAGDTPVFSAPGLITPNLVALPAGQDPQPVTYGIEQWNLVIQKFPFATMDTDMPTAVLAAVDLFLRNVQQLGLQAGQSLNRISRDIMFNAGLSGNTVATSATGSGTASLHVQRLNGFTTSCVRSGGATANATMYVPVSSSNPLNITINGVASTVTGFTPDNAGDTTGPGTLTVTGSPTWASRAAVLTADASYVVYSQQAGATTVDSITANSTLTLAAMRGAVSRARNMNIPVHPDRRFHFHVDPTGESEIFGDPEFQRVNTALPDYYMYKELAVGEFQGCLVVRNTESPTSSTVVTTSSDGKTYSPSDYFGGELVNGSSPAIPLHYGLLTGQGGLYEFWVDQGQLITEAGIAGRVGDFRIVNNGIEVYVDRCKVILREALNRLQDQVSATSLFLGGWTFRTDALTGDSARYKRAVPVIHA